MNIKRAVKILKRGGVGVIPTDTLYGLVGQALNSDTVSRICRLKKRPPGKPFIVLIGALSDLKKFKIKTDRATLNILKTLWPGPISVILPRGRDQTLACRLPNAPWLRKLVKKTGPLVAPSANPEAQPPAETIAEARKYFGAKVDFYLAGGKLIGPSSRIIKIQRGKILTIR